MKMGIRGNVVLFPETVCSNQIIWNICSLALRLWKIESDPHSNPCLSIPSPEIHCREKYQDFETVPIASMSENKTIIRPSNNFIRLMMFTRLVGLMLCIFLIVFFAGCLAPLSPARAPPGQSWRLTSYNVGNKMVKPEPNTTITLAFGPDGLISGSTICNEYHATYQFEGEILSLSNIGSTDRNCTTSIKIMEMEKVYFQLLNNTTRFSLDQNTLTLSYFDEKKLLVFERQPF